MAKTTKTTKAVKSANFKSTDALRKGFRAYVGMYGAAYEAAQPMFAKAVKNYDGFAVKGETLETLAGTYTKDARAFATKRFELRSAQVRGFFPKAANDRTAELEATIAKLNKKIVRLSKAAPKKAVKTVTKVAKKTTATVKAA